MIYLDSKLHSSTGWPIELRLYQLLDIRIDEILASAEGGLFRRLILRHDHY